LASGGAGKDRASSFEQELRVVRRIELTGGLLRACEAPGCETFTLGTFCLRHEPACARVFPRGRPFVTMPEPLGEALQLRLPRKISA
jgi:hypothetical protein